MNTFRRLAVLAALLCAAACSSPITTNTAEVQPTFAENHSEPEAGSTTTAADSSTSRNGGNLMGGN